jgi:abhydrolase domain-containing protein 17
MQFTRLIFPAPNPASYSADKFFGELLYIPRAGQYDETQSSFIPTLFLPYLNGSRKLILFFHGNAEDIGISYEMLDHLRTALRINILAVEYPGYGIYQPDVVGGDGAPDESKIYADAATVFEYVSRSIKPSNILLLGRSLGSAPSTYLASKYNPGGLILMSPYTSIKDVAHSKVGFLAWLVADFFDNLSRIPDVSCPTFIVHGQMDKLIPVSQAQLLNDACGGPTFLVCPPRMTHNEFDFYDDLIRPLMQFLVQMHILTADPNEDSTTPTPESENEKQKYTVKFPEELFIPPSKRTQYMN